ncbi:MAG: hypothetical protein AB1805_00880 [Nitrospirota bacterium]
MTLKGKRIACFIAMPQHTRFFLPIRERIIKEGGELLFIVPLAEYPFELDLIRRKLPFKYYSDYMNERVRESVKDVTLRLLSEWTKTCYKWDGFSRWPLFKQSWFFEQLVEEYFCMERFIEVERPDLFIANHECSRWGKTIGHLAYRRGIPFVTFQEGDYHTDQMAFTIHTEFSTVDLLWGQRTINFLSKYKNSSDKMIPIGNTHIDGAVHEYSTPDMRATIRKELNIPSAKKVVLFFLDILYGGMEDKENWRSILKGLEEMSGEVAYVFKWHPLVYQHAFENIKNIFKELCPSALILYTYEPYKLLAIADYCVTFGKTTLAVEAIAFGKPLFSFPNSNATDDMYVGMGVAQSVFPPGNWSPLFDTVKNGVPRDILANVKRYVEEYFYKLDGKSVERTIDIMNFVLDVKMHLKDVRPVVMREAAVAGRVSFVVPSGDDPEALLATLTSLAQNVKHPDWEAVIPVGCCSEMREVLAGVSGDMTIVDVDVPGLAHAYNKGTGAASGEHLVFMRPGIVYFNDAGLVEATKAGIAGVPLKNADMTPYCLGIGYDFNFTPYRITEEGKQPEAVGGGLVAMSRSSFDRLSGFDEEIANHLIEPDLCLKAKDAGIPVHYLPDCLAINYKETFFGSDVSDDTWRNRARFFAKWVGKLPKDDDFLSFVSNLLKI